MPGSRKKQLAIARKRTVVLLAVMLVTFVFILVRLGELVLVEQDARKPVKPVGVVRRADILDRNGELLARSLPVRSIAVFPRRIIGDPALLSRQIGKILPYLRVAAVYGALTSQANFRFIARQVTPAAAERINALGEPGIELLQERHRDYPNGAFAAHILGYVDVDGIGRDGVERTFDRTMAGSPNRPTALILSIDSRVQASLEHELGLAMLKHSAIGASGVVLNVATGEVIAMASLPQFDPNSPNASGSETRFNRATLGVYELGSTFKAMTIAMALDTGAINGMADRFDASVPLRAGRFRIHDDHAKNRWLSVPEIFAYSSNIGAARIARAVGAARQRAYLDQLGFLRPVEIELNERGRPLYPADWGEIATMTVGFGHGIAVTPLHLATAYAALVNGGVWHPATLLKADPDHPAPGRRVFSERTSKLMRELMRLVVIDGTGKQADAHGYEVGGKTGTAEKSQNGRYNHRALISTFAGAFPMTDPKYVVVAILDEPKGTADTFGFATGGWVSAPVVKTVVKTIGPMLGTMPDPAVVTDLSDVMPFINGGSASNRVPH